MIQNIIALIIVGLVVVKVIYSVYQSVTIKDKSVCGGCASCELKSELKKKGKLTSQTDNSSFRKFQGSIENLKYSLESE
jgi:hypothetical protein